jgi:hypothetical protein
MAPRAITWAIGCSEACSQRPGQPQDLVAVLTLKGDDFDVLGDYWTYGLEPNRQVLDRRLFVRPGPGEQVVDGQRDHARPGF